MNPPEQMSMDDYGNLTDFFEASGFLPENVEPQDDFGILPPEKYLTLIGIAEVKQTKAGNGHYIELPLTVVDGQYKNWKLWDRINIDNPSAECVRIGLQKLSALGRSLGIAKLTDTAQLADQVTVAHVKVKGDQNFVRTYSAPSEVPAKQVPQGSRLNATPPAHCTGITPPQQQSRPWDRKN